MKTCICVHFLPSKKQDYVCSYKFTDLIHQFLFNFKAASDWHGKDQNQLAELKMKAQVQIHRSPRNRNVV